jgi:hypothetical protein
MASSSQIKEIVPVTNQKAASPPDRTEPALIDRFLPEFDVSEYHETPVRAPGVVAYEAARGLNLGRSRITLALLVVRGAIAFAQPGRASELYGLVRRRRFTLEDIQRAGFVILGEQPGREIVLGVVGKFWKPGSGIESVEASDFVSWNRPGFAKGVLNLAIRDDGEESMVSTETRVWCTDDSARRSFRRYWRVIGPFSGFIRQRTLALIKSDAERAHQGS